MGKGGRIAEAEILKMIGTRAHVEILDQSCRVCRPVSMLRGLAVSMVPGGVSIPHSLCVVYSRER